MGCQWVRLEVSGPWSDQALTASRGLLKRELFCFERGLLVGILSTCTACAGSGVEPVISQCKHHSDLLHSVQTLVVVMMYKGDKVSAAPLRRSYSHHVPNCESKTHAAEKKWSAEYLKLPQTVAPPHLLAQRDNFGPHEDTCLQSPHRDVASRIPSSRETLAPPGWTLLAVGHPSLPLDSDYEGSMSPSYLTELAMEVSTLRLVPPFQAAGEYAKPHEALT